jgi:hypothetical protein
MRETCTSGSVRGEGGNILTYSALSDSETHQGFPEARPMVGFASAQPTLRFADVRPPSAAHFDPFFAASSAAFSAARAPARMLAMA